MYIQEYDNAISRTLYNYISEKSENNFNAEMILDSKKSLIELYNYFITEKTVIFLPQSII